MSQPSLPSKVRVTFDGGSLGNPGKGYGSYLIEGPSRSEEVVRLDFSPDGEIVSNNQAEYRTLIAALRDLTARVAQPPSEIDLEINGDSMLVIEQLAGRWKVKHPDLRPLHVEASELLRLFRSTRLTWHRRSVSVGKLGH
jgi:ribonuclease HI